MKASEKIKTYILSAVEFYDHKDDLITSEEEKIKEVMRRFNAEYWYYENQMRYNGDITKALASWLQGLPSEINIAFYYEEIDSLLIEWGAIKPTSRDATIARERNNYWLYLAGSLVSIAKRYHLV